MPSPRSLPFAAALAGPGLAFLALATDVGLAWPTAALMGGCVVLDAVLAPSRAGHDAPLPATSATATWLPRTFAPALLAFTLWTAHVFAAADVGTQVLLAVCAGIYGCTFGINVAHELIHGRSKLDRALGGLMCATLLAGSFKVEHVRGHHRDVATPLDPSSAPLGRSLYAHLPQAVLGNWTKGWALETRRVRRLGLPWWRHELVGWATVSLGVLGLAALVAGPQGVVFVGVQGVLARVNLEIINYVEHYGLRRDRRPSGRFEPVRPCHSWTSEHPVSRVVLLNLPRHADHHAAASRPWSTLRHHADAPELPAGYPAMFLLALVPPVWHAVMDDRVRAFTGTLSARAVASAA